MAASVTLVLTRLNPAELPDPEKVCTKAGQIILKIECNQLIPKPSEDLPSPPVIYIPDTGVSEPVTTLICGGCFLCSGYHRLKEGAVPTIFELHAKPRRKSKLNSSKLAKYQRKQICGCRNAESSTPLCMDVSCFPVQELPSPGAAPTTGELRSQPNLPGSEPENLATLTDIPLEQLPAATGQEEASPSPALPEPVGDPSQPVSLSLYMLRLPPPAGAYIQNEHSYQVGSALLWKRRAEAALDALGKTQRQLQACRRREQRLRLRICELQRERRPHSADAHRRFKEHLQVFELQLVNDIE
ncbi:THAP domain-containing protein 7 isoform X4 [Thamnophis elegans]|nr:THAP domain-containing protein 7 isoform X4 [Thamnophis elegans]